MSKKVNLDKMIDTFTIAPLTSHGDCLLVVADDKDRVVAGAYFQTEFDADSAIKAFEMLKSRADLTDDEVNEDYMTTDEFIELFVEKAKKIALHLPRVTSKRLH